MAQVSASTSSQIDAPPERVVEFLRDYRDARPRILTDHYRDYRVEQGGDGPGTVIAYRFAAGGREREYRLEVEDSEDGLRERDQLSSFSSTWTVRPTGNGSTVTLEASWQGAGGIRGFFESMFAPLGLRRIYSEVLDRLAAALT